MANVRLAGTLGTGGTPKTSHRMTNAQPLAVVRGVHTFIYIMTATSTFVLVYAGLTGAEGWWLWVALTLLAMETVVFAGSRMKRPLTALAVSYGAEKGYAFDTFLPERVTRHTFRFFDSLMLIAGPSGAAVAGRDRQVASFTARLPLIHHTGSR